MRTTTKLITASFLAGLCAGMGLAIIIASFSLSFGS